MADLPKLDQAYKTWQSNKNDESLQQVLDAADPVISAGLRTYGGVGKKEDPILKMEATRIVRDALDRYDPNKAKLNTYLMYNLRGLARTTHRRAHELKLPQKAWYDLQNMKAARDAYMLENDEEPSLIELADETGLSTRRLKYLQEFERSAIPESALRTDEENFFAPGTRADSDFWAEAVYYSLAPRDQKIFDYRLGAHGKQRLTNMEIGRKLGISPAAVSQRVNRIIELLKQGERRGM